MTTPPGAIHRADGGVAVVDEFPREFVDELDFYDFNGVDVAFVRCVISETNGAALFFNLYAEEEAPFWSEGGGENGSGLTFDKWFVAKSHGVALGENPDDNEALSVWLPSHLSVDFALVAEADVENHLAQVAYLKAQNRPPVLNSPKPKSADEQEVWLSRAAFLDALYYMPIGSNPIGNPRPIRR